MKTTCKYCNKLIDMLIIDKNIGAYYNSKREIVCYDCMINEEILLKFLIIFHDGSSHELKIFCKNDKKLNQNREFLKSVLLQYKNVREVRI